MEGSNMFIHLLNGLSYGFLLFLLASGLSLVLSLMGVINMAHGSFYMLGAYIGISIIRSTGSFLLATLGAAAAVAVIGLAVERLFLGKLYKKQLEQVLLTFGFCYIFMDLTRSIWGRAPLSTPKPPLLSGSVIIAGGAFPVYRLGIIVIGFILALLLWLFLERTKAGTIIRAGVDDPEMTSSMGINIKLYFSAVFALGAFLAALGGVLGGPVIGAYAGADSDILILGLAIVVIGGIGTLRGTLFGSILIGFAETMGKVLLPNFSIAITYIIMASILILKPSGLLGKEELL